MHDNVKEFESLPKLPNKPIHWILYFIRFRDHLADICKPSNWDCTYEWRDLHAGIDQRRFDN